MKELLTAAITYSYAFMEKVGIHKDKDKVLHFVIMFIYAILMPMVVSIFFTLMSAQAIMVGRELYNVYNDWKNNGRPIKLAMEKFNMQDIFAGEFGLIVGLFIYAVLKILI